MPSLPLPPWPLPTLRIAVNTRLLIKDKLEGIGRFTFESLQILVEQRPKDHFILFFDRPYDKQFIFGKNVTAVVLGPKARHPLSFIIWLEWSVRRALRKYKADVFLSPDGYLSLLSRKPAVAVIHDLNFEHYPNDLPYFARWYYRTFFRWFAKKAKLVATVSNFSMLDLEIRYKVPKSKLRVVYNGVSKGFQPVSTEHKDAIRKEFFGGHEYFFYIGSIHPRKNISRLIEAFDLFKARTNNTVKLVLSGARYWWTDEMEDTLEAVDHREDIIFTGRIPQEELFQFMAAATALTYVSYFEGFGIPVIEAMRCEVPIITSNQTSLPEIAGDAAIIVDPFSHVEIADAMQKVYENKDLRKKLIEKGRLRAGEFTWEKTAMALGACLDAAVKK